MAKLFVICGHGAGDPGADGGGYTEAERVRAEKIVHHSELANVNRAARRGINYRLVENGFIDSPVDLAYFNEHVDDIARVYLEVFGIAASSAPSEPEAGASGPGSTGFAGGTYRCTVGTLNVRDAPGLSGSVVAKYHEGQTVVLDSWYVSRDGYVWGRYTGATSGKLRYVAVGRATGKPEADDYLVRVG